MMNGELEKRGRLGNASPPNDPAGRDATRVPLAAMTENPAPSRVLLADSDGPGRITVDYEAFAEFEGQMEAALSALVDRWLPLAAPGASRARRRSQAFDALGPQGDL